MKRAALSSSSRRRIPSNEAARTGFASIPVVWTLLAALVLSCGMACSPLAAQEALPASERTATEEPVAEAPVSDDEPQALHDTASLDADSSTDETATPPASVAASETVAETPATPKSDLLGERLAAGEGAEKEPLHFDHEGVAYVLVTTEPHATRQRAKNELDQIMLAEAQKRYAEATQSSRAEFWFPIDLAFVRGELLAPDGERFVAGAGGQPGYVGHALLTFDQAFERRLRAVRVASRSMQIVVAGGAALGLLCVAFAFLRLDRATRGLYTGRLQTWSIVAGAVVLCIAGAAAYWVPWI